MDPWTDKPATNPLTVKVGDILKVANVGDRLFRGFWDMAEYIIPPGSDDYMPFEAMKSFFGDPRSGRDVRSDRDQRGQVGFVADRAAEVRRLRLLYDHGFGDYTGREGPDVVWEQHKIPHVEVHTLQGERIWTVLEDPAGATQIAASRTEAEERNLRDVVAQQGQLIEQLMSRVRTAESVSAEMASPIYTAPNPTFEHTKTVLQSNVYHPDTDEIGPQVDDDPTLDPTVYDELPEDR